MNRLKVLLVNPYIYDFSAYSFWSNPLGLLYIGAILRQNGMEISLIDCLQVVEAKRKGDGRGPFIKEKAVLPVLLKDTKKKYRRYGISREAFLGKCALLPPPDLILVTSIMTYWYPGTLEAVGTLRHAFPTAKIVLGGIYPSLCYEHALATMTRADLVVRNSEISRFYAFLEEAFATRLIFKPSPYDFTLLPFPCHDLYESIPFVPLLASYGCSYRCTYCATPYMHPDIVRRSPDSLLEEVSHWLSRDVSRFVLYDDNFLYRRGLYAKPFLRALTALGKDLKLYNPNALNAAMIDEEVALLLRQSGFKEVRIGLETVNPGLQQSTGGKVDAKTFETAVGHLVAAGFDAEAIKAYILTGLPMQRKEGVRDAIDYCFAVGVSPYLAEYTPIPHTPLFDQYRHLARYPIAEDPIYQNNALMPFAWEGFTEKDLLEMKVSLRGSVRSRSLVEPQPDTPA
jgi:hypothetical protein